MNQKCSYNEIESSFLTLKDLRSAAFMRHLLRILDEYAKEFGVEGYTLSHAEKPCYKPLNEDHILNEIWRPDDDTGEFPWIYFGGNKPYGFQLSCDVGDGSIVKGRYEFSSVDAVISRKYFLCEDDAEKRRRLETYLKFCKRLYDFLRPLFGDTHDIEDKMAVSVSLGRLGMFSFLGLTHSMEFGLIRQPDIDCPIGGVSWANYFGPGCVRFFGRDHLLKAPGVVNTEELGDGGLLLLIAPHPLTPDDPEHRANQLALWRYLGLKPRPKPRVISRFKTDDWKGIMVQNINYEFDRFC